MDDGDYRERLLPKWWAWLAALIPVLMLAVAYGGALGTGSGLIVAVVGVVLVGWLLWISAPVTVVSAAGLRVSSGRLPLTSIGDVTVVDHAGIVALRGPGGDARLFVELRPWSARDAVLINLDDADDPHPAWLISSRHPVELQRAMESRLESA
jgi:hypothetical protein